MRNEVRFLLGDEPRTLADASPTMTVLEYLRRVERRCGTKEGCAEGDCGACTVVVAEPDGKDGLRYRAVNSCIRFLPSLDGCQLLTVEDLGAPKMLHPVQQALCDSHGSQCGFCTPGIVMSLFAATKAGARPDRNGWKSALAGNLCRCTGYGPILDAAESLDGTVWQGRDLDREAELAASLAALDGGEPLALENGTGRWFAARTLDGALELLRQHPDARLVAGATDVGLWVTKQHRRIETIIWLGRVRELVAIGGQEESSDLIEIGAGATVQEMLAAVGGNFPTLVTLIGRFASEQIRNVATVGGNIANGSPIGDLAPVFIALGATLVLRHAGGSRTIPVEDFFIAYGRQDLRPGELIASIRVPKPAAGQRFACYKISKRFEQDISAVMGAFSLTEENGVTTGARLAFGGMAGTPARARAAEAALAGRPFDEAAVAAAMTALDEDFTPITDMRASAAYRRAVARNLILKFYLETIGEDGVSRLDAGLVP